MSRANEALGRLATLTVACQRRDQGYPLANAGRSNAERSQRASPSGASAGTPVAGEHGEEREWQDHKVLSRQSCSECVLAFNPGEIVRGRDLKWRLGVMSETAKTIATFQVMLSLHLRRKITWGTQGLALAHVGPFASQEFVTSHFDQASFDAFRVQMMPKNSGAATKFVLGKNTVPVSNNHEFFPGLACNGCRAVVQSRANLTGTWNIVVRGGSFGGAFSVVLQLLRTCPHSCSGNGICMRRNTYACKCYAGYEGIDCSLAVRAKLACWYPLFSDLLDRSGNDLELVLQAQPAIAGQLPSESVRLIQDEIGGAVGMFGGYLASTAHPTSRTHCTHANQKESLVYLADDQEAAVREPMKPETLCATYDVGHEFAVMAWFYASEKPSNNSGITLGARLWQTSISPSNDQFSWSFMLSLIGHPRKDQPGFFVNFAVNQEDSAADLRIASARDLDSFPERGWPQPRWEPLLPTQRWVHVAGVYACDRIQLFIDGQVVVQVKAPMRKMRRVQNAVRHIGHDSRYPASSRVFLGKIKDVRLLRYPPSSAEVRMAAKGLYALALQYQILKTASSKASGVSEEETKTVARASPCSPNKTRTSRFLPKCSRIVPFAHPTRACPTRNGMRWRELMHPRAVSLLAGSQFVRTQLKPWSKQVKHTIGLTKVCLQV